jgi:hypothetical protein
MDILLTCQIVDDLVVAEYDLLMTWIFTWIFQLIFIFKIIFINFLKIKINFFKNVNTCIKILDEMKCLHDHFL